MDSPQLPRLELGMASRANHENIKLALTLDNGKVVDCAVSLGAAASFAGRIAAALASKPYDRAGTEMSLTDMFTAIDQG